MSTHAKPRRAAGRLYNLKPLKNYHKTFHGCFYSETELVTGSSLIRPQQHSH